MIADYIETARRVRDIAIAAGKLVTATWDMDKQYDCKDGKSNDLVTQTDRQVEQLIFSNLRDAYPNHRFMGEEGSGDCVDLTDDPTWVVDPIDGTTNFVHNLDNTAISIALCIKKRAVFGAIYNPVRQDYYYAVEGGGAFLENLQTKKVSKLTTSPTTDLTKALVCTEFGAAYGDPAKVHAKWTRQLQPLLLHPVHGIRQLGAATMNLMAVARGSAVAYIESGLKPWDMAAGELIVREAGGVVTAIDEGVEFELTGAQLMATGTAELSAHIHRLFLNPANSK